MRFGTPAPVSDRQGGWNLKSLRRLNRVFAGPLAGTEARSEKRADRRPCSPRASIRVGFGFLSSRMCSGSSGSPEGGLGWVLGESVRINEKTDLLPHQKRHIEVLKVHSHQGGLCLIIGEPGTGKSVLKTPSWPQPQTVAHPRHQEPPPCLGKPNRKFPEHHKMTNPPKIAATQKFDTRGHKTRSKRGNPLEITRPQFGNTTRYQSGAQQLGVHSSILSTSTILIVTVSFKFKSIPCQ